MSLRRCMRRLRDASIPARKSNRLNNATVRETPMLKKYLNCWKNYFLVWQFIDSSKFPCYFHVLAYLVYIQINQLAYLMIETYADRKSINSLRVILCFYQKKSWWSFRHLKDVSWKRSWRRLLEKVLRTSHGRRLKDVSWNTSLGRLLDDVFRASLGRRLDDVLKKGHRDFHFRPI